MSQNTIFNPVETITKKRNGEVLSEAEIKSFVDGIVSGDVKKYQASAWLMASYLQGLNKDETVALTKSMLYSGKVLDKIDDTVIDKHSTGGIGDKASLVLGPIAAAAGVKVPMIAGRGLGHTGGTVDKIESIEGFQTGLDLEEFQVKLHEHGMVLIGQTNEIAPADKILYSLRDVTGTVSSIPLITASIMSKKLAEGISGLVMDVKFGSGAFMKKKSDARRLAKSIADVAQMFDKKCVAFLTNMNWPLGDAVGHSLEIIECIETLQGKGPKDLEKVSLEMAAAMIEMAGIEKSSRKAMARAKQTIKDGTALAKFRELIRAQGGDETYFDDFSKFDIAPIQTDIIAPKTSYIKSFNNREIGMACLELGGGRKSTEDVIDFGVGIKFHMKPGQRVKEGQAIGTIYHRENQQEKVEIILKKFHNDVIKYAKTRPQLDPLILDKIVRT